MKRRHFLAATALLPLLPAAQARPHRVENSASLPVTEKPPAGSSATHLPPVRAPDPPALWSAYELTLSVTLKAADRHAKVWLPMPYAQDTLYQRTQSISWKSNAEVASLRRLPDGELEVFVAEWQGDVAPQLQVTTVVSTADRHFDISRRTMPPEREDILRRSLQASQLIPNDGLAFQLAERILGRIRDPIAQAKAIYDWVIDNTIYDMSLPGCGTGDVRQQLVRGEYGGRSADINGLFVALCRAIGIPARCVYGVRVGPSRLFRSLGLTSEDATRLPHCRAEFYVPGYGWVPVDPGDVRRAIALERLDDRNSNLIALKKLLFGVWEMNWIAFNYATDVVLPTTATPVPFFTLPQSERDSLRNAGLEPESFRYSMTARRAD